MSAGQRVTAVEAVPPESTFLFVVERSEDGTKDEAVLVRVDDGVACYLNRCMHYRHIRLDKGDGAAIRSGEIVCENHGAYFESDSGHCTFGPCEGAYLDELTVEIRNGDVYFTDEAFEFVEVGGLDTDPADLSSKSNIKF